MTVRSVCLGHTETPCGHTSGRHERPALPPDRRLRNVAFEAWGRFRGSGNFQQPAIRADRRNLDTRWLFVAFLVALCASFFRFFDGTRCRTVAGLPGKSA